MRITNNYMSDSVLRNLARNTERMYGLQDSISTGKRINKPSDDPVGMGYTLEFREKIASIEQYGRNIQWGESWLRTTDATLDSINSQLIRAKELAVYQTTETSTATTRSSTAEEVKSLYDQVIQLANTKLQGRHLFAGQITDTAPYTRDGAFNATYAGNGGNIQAIIGDNVEITINTIGSDVFDSTVNVFDVLKGLKDGLESNDTDAIAAQIEGLDDAMKQLQNERAQVGARIERMETTRSHWDTFKLNTQEMLSTTEDIDLVETMTDLKSMETAYEAALAAAASVIQPSLIQFLR